jgi:hypothetical protein
MPRNIRRTGQPQRKMAGKPSDTDKIGCSKITYVAVMVKLQAAAHA